MGWTNPPEPVETSRGLQVATTVAIVAGLVCVAIVAGFIAFAVGMSRLSLGLKNLHFDPFRPTAAETRAAVSTVPIAPTGCVAFARVERATERVADATNFDLRPQPTAADAGAALVKLHLALQDAISEAKGPMIRRLRNADQDTWAARLEVARWHGVVPTKGLTVGSSRLFEIGVEGYSEIAIADRLLGSTCRGRLAPDLSRMLLGPPARTSTTVSKSN